MHHFLRWGSESESIVCLCVSECVCIYMGVDPEGTQFAFGTRVCWKKHIELISNDLDEF